MLLSDFFSNLIIKTEKARRNNTVFPPEEDMFRAFYLTHFEDVKVVIIGQDPYHGAGQANGLAFSVHRGIKIPPSLKNIFKELCADIGCKHPGHGDLTSWAVQGVLMINSVLTVEEGQAGSHRKMGWQKFTDEAISQLSQKRDNILFLLWGNYAMEKAHLIDQQKHHIMTAMHPSPLSAYRGFFGCAHFSKVNEILKSQKKKVITWQLKE